MSVVKRIIQSNLFCRFRKAVPRLTTNVEFTCRSSECKQIFSVNKNGSNWFDSDQCGRNLLKKYICIFTSLASQIVHFEIVKSLEASAFLQAFQRFCFRQNIKPRNLHINNGESFVTAEQKIKEGVKRRNQRHLHNKLR